MIGGGGREPAEPVGLVSRGDLACAQQTQEDEALPPHFFHSSDYCASKPK